MASIIDIPVELLEPLARKPFLDWLARQQVDPSAKRRIMRLYMDLLDTTFTAREHVEAGAND